MLRISGWLALALVATGCSIDDIDYAGKGCSPEAPCPDGLVCSAGVCTSGPACTPAFSVSELERVWEAPRSVRWGWVPAGTKADFVQYKLVLGTTDDELQAAQSLALSGQNDEVPGGLIWTSDDNPELGQYELRLSGDTDLVTSTTTDGLDPGREYRARMLVYDSAACVFESETAVALTRPLSSLSYTLFDDQAHPQGIARPEGVASVQTDASQAHEGESYVFWPGWPDDGSANDGDYENVGIYEIGTDPAQHYPQLDFSAAYLELAVAVDGAPLAAWGEVRLLFASPSGECDGTQVSSIHPYAFRAGSGYQVLELPLDQFRFPTGPVDSALVQARGVCEVSVGRSFAIGESVRVDAIHLRW